MAKPSPGSRCPALVQSPHYCVTASGNAQISAQYGLNPDALWGTGPLLIKTKNTNDEDTIAYYHHDHLQTPVQATDALGNIVWAASYDAFGRATITTPQATADKPTISSNLRLPGQYDDSETGLHYNWNRYYDPETGRYITADPIGLNGGLNTYGYVNGNPLNLIDPEGKILPALGISYLICVAECLAEQAVINGIQKVVNDGQSCSIDEPLLSGSDLKDCAVSCLLGPLGRIISWFKKGNKLKRGVSEIDNIGPTNNYVTKKGSPRTEPTLPPKTVAEGKGVKIQHYTKSGDHGPAHMHVKGGGPETKIGQNGKPIKGSPNPTSTQQSVIDANKSTIRKAAKKMQRYHDYQRNQ